MRFTVCAALRVGVIASDSKASASRGRSLIQSPRRRGRGASAGFGCLQIIMLIGGSTLREKLFWLVRNAGRRLLSPHQMRDQGGQNRRGGFGSYSMLRAATSASLMYD